MYAGRTGGRDDLFVVVFAVGASLAADAHLRGRAPHGVLFGEREHRLEDAAVNLCVLLDHARRIPSREPRGGAAEERREREQRERQIAPAAQGQIGRDSDEGQRERCRRHPAPIMFFEGSAIRRALGSRLRLPRASERRRRLAC